MVVTSSTHGYCSILRRRAEHSDCRAAHCYHITTSPRCRASNGTSSPSYHITKSLTTQPTNTPKHNPSLSNPNLINYRTLSNTASPSYHITKSLTTQPTKHTTKSPTSHLPPQTHNTHQNISPHSHNTTQSTTTLLATYHHPISPKKSLITQPAKLIDTQLYQNQHHTHHTNKLTPHLQTNHLSSHRDITHLTPTTPKLTTPPLTLKHTAKSTNTLSPTHHHTPQLKSQKSLITQHAKLIDTQLYQKQHHTHHTNKLAPPHKTNHLSTHRDITHLTSTTPKLTTPTQKPPFTLITQLNHLLHSHQHITLISHHKNLSPPNLQNTPKHNPSLSNPNLINYRTLTNTASP